jgi:L-threonylcarbamoyladenylate synthase
MLGSKSRNRKINWKVENRETENQMEDKQASERIIKIDRTKPDYGLLKPAAIAARDGHLVVFPTDTVYGLGTNALIPGAVGNIFAVKERLKDKPLIILVADSEDVMLYVSEVNETAKKLIASYWPGPLTLIFKKSDIVPDIVTAGGETVGIRCPNDEIARTLIRTAGVGLATTSANISGATSPLDAAGVVDSVSENVSYIVNGGPTPLGVESTVVDVSWGEPAMVREGALSWRDIISSLDR